MEPPDQLPPIDERVAALLIQLIGRQLSAHQAFAGTSLYFERQDLPGWARLFHGQSVEKAQQATKIINFLVQNGIGFALPALGAGTADHASAAAAVQDALAIEMAISSQLAALDATATETADRRSREFLQPFVDEQAEGDRVMRSLVDLVDGGVDLRETDDLPDGVW